MFRARKQATFLGALAPRKTRKQRLRQWLREREIAGRSRLRHTLLSIANRL